MLNLKQNLQPKTSPTIALNQKVKELQAAGDEIINMSIGENRFPPPSELIDTFKKYSNQITYSDPQGLFELRKAISMFYKGKGRVISEENIVVSPGSKSGLYILMMALEGDLMLIKPSWVSYAPQAKHNGKKVFWIETKFENNYVPTVEELISAYESAKDEGQDPKILILNYPNNPTSYLPSKRELKQIVNTAKELNLTIISDELYLDLVYDDKSAISPSEIDSENVIVVGGISKFLSVAGSRVGWIVTPQTSEGERLTAILKALASDVWSNVSTNLQYAVAEYLTNGNYNEYIGDNKALHKQRNKLVYSEFRKLGIETVESKAGFYVYSNFNKFKKKLSNLGINNGIELQNYLLVKHKIACLSGVNFGDREDSFTLRMSTSFLDCNDAYQAKKLYSKYLNSEDKTDFVNKETHPELFGVIEKIKSFIESL